MAISASKLKGLIAVCLILAIIPFVCLMAHKAIKYKTPVFANQCDNCQAIEIVDGGQRAGIYFVPPGTTVNELLQSAGFQQTSSNNFPLTTGTRLVINSASASRDITVREMPNNVRFSIGLPVNINTASEEDLILVKGIGRATAQKIIALRTQLNGFEDIKQLMEIKGIKEKRLTEIQKYLYVEKRQKT
jgi:competence ComEA-like helix-hairpin-helix protein